VAIIMLTQESPFVRGVFVGAFVVAWLGLVWFGVVVGSGQLRHFWGRSGERATAEVFGSRRLRRKGWSVVHGLVVQDHEIDHVAIGPGGVVAVETKWVTGEQWVIEGGQLRGPLGNPVGQTRRSASRVGELLRSSTGGRHHVDVLPVLMIWGPGSPIVTPHTREIDGVQIFTARTVDDLRQWLSEDRLDLTQAATIARQLEDYALVQQRAARTRPKLRSRSVR
jgi:hypothetical protein